MSNDTPTETPNLRTPVPDSCMDVRCCVDPFPLRTVTRDGKMEWPVPSGYPFPWPVEPYYDQPPTGLYALTAPTTCPACEGEALQVLLGRSEWEGICLSCQAAWSCRDCAVGELAHDGCTGCGQCCYCEPEDADA